MIFLTRLLLGFVFLVSTLPKLLAPRRTGRDVQNYRILPAALATAYGWALGPVELVAGLSLLSGYGARAGAVVVLLLLTSFMAAVGIVMARKQNLTCTCFGLLYRERVGWATQGRDAVLWLLALAVAVWGTDALSFGDLATSGSLLGLAGTVFNVIVLALALGLGWVAARGWPRWLLRARGADKAGTGGLALAEGGTGVLRPDEESGLRMTEERAQK